MTQALSSAIEFFYEHAGYSYDPKTQTEEEGHRETATYLARAEKWAKDHDVSFTWEDDWGVDHQKEFDCYEDGGPDTCEMCAALQDGKVITAIGCVDDATPEYRRVIEAQLAAEARDWTFVWVERKSDPGIWDADVKAHVPLCAPDSNTSHILTVVFGELGEANDHSKPYWWTVQPAWGGSREGNTGSLLDAQQAAVDAFTALDDDSKGTPR